MSHYEMKIFIKSSCSFSEVSFFRASINSGTSRFEWLHGQPVVVVTDIKGQVNLWAKAWSKSKLVDRVIVTHVAETHVGVWSEGKELTT